MSQPTSEGIWERIRGGRHGALVGVAMPKVPADIRAIRVSCDVPPSTFGPLLEARRRIEVVLGEEVPLVSQARERMVSGLRRHLFGELPQTGADAFLVEVANRLAQQSDRRSVLIFDAVEAADEATLATLRELLLRPHWLRLPMLLVFRTRHPTGLAGALLDTLLRVEGFAAVIQAREERTEVARVSWQGLAPEVIQVLRAGSVIGAGFEVDLVARLLEISPLEVLLRLQAAADAGAPLEDRGEGRIHLGEAWLRSLRDGILPSLARLWHHRLGALLAGEEGEGAGAGEDTSDAMEAAAGLVGGPADRELLAEVRAEAAAVDAREANRTEPQAPDTVVTAPRRPSVLEEIPAPVEAAPSVAEPVAEASEDDAEAARVEAEVRAQESAAPGEEVAQESAAEEPAEDPASPEDAAPPAVAAREESAPRPAATPREESRPQAAAHSREGSGPRSQAPVQEVRIPPAAGEGRDASARVTDPRPRRHRRPRDPARAATHLREAGERDAAAEHFLEAAQEAAGAGAEGQALAHARRALALLEGQPSSPRRRRTRLSALLEVARIQWRSAGDHPSLSLETAMATAEAARSLLADDDPPELRAQVAQVLAGIGYDRGDLRSLEQALAALTSASRALMAAGDPLGAASLLNDQAAIYIRLGDPVQALHLLGESRKVFEGRGEDEPLAIVELAETHHLYARVPLHARVQAGRERDALLMGLDHALIADKLYARLDDRRERARVWETMGRLELRRGQRERAAERLSAALEAQQALGDALGLARTSAALAEVLAAQGRLDGALRLLAASIAVNREKGSHVGLAYNRQALAALAPLVPEQARGLVGALERELRAAEKLLGRRPLPPGLEVGSEG